MLKRRKIRLNRSKSVKSNVRRIVARISHRRKIQNRHLSYFLISEQL